METIDITKGAKRIIKYGLVGLIVLSTAIGGAAFNYQHRDDTINLNNAKVNGTMVSVRVLTNGRIKELTKSDGDEVKAGEVIAKIEVSVTEEQIEQLEKVVDLAKQNYAKLEVGQMVKVAVQKPRVRTVQIPNPSSMRQSNSRSRRNSTTSVAALEERKKRMELLYEMGAISRKELEEAKKEYELAKAAGGSSAQPSSNLVPQFSTSTEIEYETEYVEQLQPTPPEVLEAAKKAIKQAELSLNVAKQEAQQTELIATVDGTIFYSVAVDEEVKAGDVVSRIGDNRELWVEAEVTEEQFNKIPLGKFVSYIIDGNKVTGTVIDKIAPVKEEEVKIEEKAESSENPPTTPNNPAENSTPNTENNQTSMLNKYNGVGGPEDNAETPSADKDKNESAAPTEGNKPAEPEKPAESAELNANSIEKNDKYIIKFSLPVDRDFKCKPNMNVSVSIKM